MASLIGDSDGVSVVVWYMLVFGEVAGLCVGSRYRDGSVSIGLIGGVCS